MAIGMAYVAEGDLNDAFEILKGLAEELQGKKLQEFGVRFIAYFDKVLNQTCVTIITNAALSFKLFHVLFVC